MSDAPPAYMDEAPPYDGGGYSGGGNARPAGGNQRNDNGGGRRQQPKMTPQEIEAAAADFWTWLTSPETREQLRLLLPDHIDADLFLSTCKTAVLTKPEMLREDLRQSLLTAVIKAASQGLLPDGKQGALVSRYDSDAKGYRVVWQPMVWGVTKLGRETGAIKAIRAVLVFTGEPFRVVQGEEDRIEHEVDIDIADAAYGALSAGKDQFGNPKANPDAFMQHLRAAYCFIYGTDGTVVRRWMTKNRIQSLRDASKAANGPWNSRWMDEMILKGVILFTSKWINLDPNTAAAKRFQAALLTDLEVDFDQQGRLIQADDDKPPQAALPPPPTKLNALEDAIAGTQRPREKATVQRQASSPAQPQTAAQGGAPSGAGAPPASPLAHDERPFIERAEARLAAVADVPSAWVSALVEIVGEVPTVSDLTTIHMWPAVRTAQEKAPNAIKQRISEAFRAAAERLAEGDADDSAAAEDPPANDDDKPLAEVLTVGDAMDRQVDAEIERIRAMPERERARYAMSPEYLKFVQDLTRATRTELAVKLAAALRETGEAA